MSVLSQDAATPGASAPRDEAPTLHSLAAEIKRLGTELGFQQVGIARTELSEDEARLLAWLAKGRHGEMHYMARHGLRRTRPALLEPGTISVISVRMDYLAPGTASADTVLENAEQGFISRYALGRDYHKVMRKRLQRLADRIATLVGPFGYRAFVDSAPVLEKALARNAGLGWIGKHTNLLNRAHGSWFFLGELYTDLPLPPDAPVKAHCGQCQACIDVCPTAAIVAPYQLDARRCVSYLTIEHHGSIPLELRPLMGNRIYGCDDCQMVCPWNRFAKLSAEADFSVRHGLDAPELSQLLLWTREEFARKTEGSAIRRIGHVRWLRNVAVALGNGPPHDRACRALAARRTHPSALVREHVEWAVEQLAGRARLESTDRT